MTVLGGGATINYAVGMRMCSASYRHRYVRERDIGYPDLDCT